VWINEKLNQQPPSVLKSANSQTEPISAGNEESPTRPSAVERVVIVEDSEADRLNLRVLLGRMPGVDLVGEARGLAEAREVLRRTGADVVFLDIELGPGQNGFDLLNEEWAGLRVVFTTVHRDYAVEAFRVGAADYLVKPVTEAELLRAMGRIRPRAHRIAPQVAVSRSGSAKRLIPLETIAAVLADGNNSRLLCGSMDYPDRRSFREWVELLEGLPFVELDRSTTLRMDQVVSWNSHGTGGLVTLRNAAKPIELGRTAYRRFREILEAAGTA
jgi:two-component system LytT family response regulator